MVCAPRRGIAAGFASLVEESCSFAAAWRLQQRFLITRSSKRQLRHALGVQLINQQIDQLMQCIPPIGLAASAAEIAGRVPHIGPGLDPSADAFQVDSQVKIPQPAPQPERPAEMGHDLLTM
jgi:hypothetical protein